MKFATLKPFLALAAAAVLVGAAAAAGGENPKDNKGAKKPDENTGPLVIKENLTNSDPFDWMMRNSHHKVHTIRLKANNPYTIELSANFLPYLRLEDFRGNQLPASINLAGKTTRIQFTPTENEEYRIVVISRAVRATGPYTLTIKGLTPAKQIFKVQDKLTPNDPFDKARPQHHHKVHMLKLKPGETYTIHMTTQTFDGWLRLEDSKGIRIDENDDWMDTRNSRIVFTPQKEDTYRIIATTFRAGDTGAYTITVSTGG